MGIILFLSRETNSEVMCCRFSLDGSLLAAGLASGVIKVRIFWFPNEFIHPTRHGLSNNQGIFLKKITFIIENYVTK